MKNLIYLKNVVTLQINAGKCIGCGICLDVCPHEVLSINGKHVQLSNRDACMECGACSRNCPVNALSVNAGVGCAAAVINDMLNRQGSSCCCSIDKKDSLLAGSDNNTCCS